MEKFSSLLINIAEHKDVQKLWGVSVFSVSADGWVLYGTKPKLNTRQKPTKKQHGAEGMMRESENPYCDSRT